MIGLSGRGVEVDAPRTAGRVFVPTLEFLEGRTVPGYGKVKIDFEVANPEVPAHVSTLPPPAAGLAAPPADAGEAAGLIHLPGDGKAGFDRGAGGFELAKTDKDKFEPYYESARANKAVLIVDVWVGA